MKKLLRNLLFAGAAMCLCQPLTAGAADAVLLDNADVLTAEELDTCRATLNDTADEIGMNVLVIIGGESFPEGAAKETAELTYEQEFGDSDGVCLFLDAREENAQHYFCAAGLAKLYYTDTTENRVSVMFDEMESFLYPPADMAGAISILDINLDYYYNVGMVEGETVQDSSGMYYYFEDDTLKFSETPPEENGGSGDPAASEEPEETEPEKNLSDYAGTGNAVLYDEAQWLSASEYDECLAKLQEAADETGMNVGMVLGSQMRSDYTIQSLADASYDQLFGPNTDGLLYYMDLSGQDSPYDYISTCGMGQMYYTNDTRSDRINAIFDAVFPYLIPSGSEDVVGAIGEFSEQVTLYYHAGVPDNYYVYDDVYNEYYYVKDGKLAASSRRPYVSMESVLGITGGGFVIGLIAALITFFAVKTHYKFKSALAPTAYVNRKNLTFHNQYDRFVRQYTSRVRIESSSGGGGGGGGGGGSSSGGHGGGGRHR